MPNICFFHFQFVTDVVYASSYLFTFNIFLTSTLGNLFSFSLEEHSSGVNLLRGYTLHFVKLIKTPKFLHFSDKQCLLTQNFAKKMKNFIKQNVFSKFHPKLAD